MSKEFEEVVLKKLEKLDNMEELMQEVVLPKLDKLDNMEKLMQEVVLPKLNNTDNAIKELSIEIKDLNNKFTVFDYEINKKIDSLFDAFVVNTEKDSVHEEKINSLDDKLFDHGIRILNLENKILTA